MVAPQGAAATCTLGGWRELLEERARALPYLLFPNLAVKPDSWDQRLKKLVTGLWLGWGTVNPMDGCDRS